MPADAISRYGPCAYRFIDYPRPGSIYTMPDIPSLVRGPTIVRLDNGHDMIVPANFKQDVKSMAQTHDMEDGDSLLKQLSAMLSGKKVPEGPTACRASNKVAERILCRCRAANKTCRGLRRFMGVEHTVTFNSL